MHLSQLKAQAIHLMYTQNEKELCRPLPIFHGICKKNQNIKVDIWVIFREDPINIP
jgi:hypothetical protein